MCKSLNGFAQGISGVTSKLRFFRVTFGSCSAKKESGKPMKRQWPIPVAVLAWQKACMVDNINDARELTKYWTDAMPAVAAFLRSRVVRFHDAQDLLQEVASDIVVQFPQYDPTRSFTAWALGIAHNKLKLYYRQTATQKRVLSDLAMARLAEAVEKVYQDSGETAAALNECLKRLDSRSRELLNFRYVDDLTHAEVAERKSAGVSAIKVALHRIRRGLLRCIEDRMVHEGAS
jgi:RNA polymerase sigma-70 factor (ECF subfamily)